MKTMLLTKVLIEQVNTKAASEEYGISIVKFLTLITKRSLTAYPHQGIFPFSFLAFLEHKANP